MPAAKSSDSDHGSLKQPSRERKAGGRVPLRRDMAPGPAISRASLASGLLNPGQLRKLQRTIGNQAVDRMLARMSEPARALAQRKQGDPDKGVAEAEYATVAKGKTINFTKLAAGCMAITAYFSDGGGVGYHFAMMADNAAQWTEFMGQVGGKGLAKLQVDSDMIGEKQGWWVHYAVVDIEMFEYGDPDTTQGPMSYAKLKESLGTDTDIFNAGWEFDGKQVAAWLQAALGVAPTVAVTQSPGPYVL